MNGVSLHCRLIIALALPDFAVEYPGIDTAHGAPDREADLIEEGVD